VVITHSSLYLRWEGNFFSHGCMQAGSVNQLISIHMSTCVSVIYTLIEQSDQDFMHLEHYQLLIVKTLQLCIHIIWYPNIKMKL